MLHVYRLKWSAALLCVHLTYMTHGYFVLQVLNVLLVVWLAISCQEIDGIIYLSYKNNVSMHICKCTCMVDLVTLHCICIHKYNFWVQMEAVLWFSLFLSFPSIPQKFEQCTHFIDNLCSQEDLTSVFPTSLSLLPPGLAKITSADFASSLATRAKKSDRGAVTSASQATEKKYVHQIIIYSKIIEIVGKVLSMHTSPSMVMHVHVHGMVFSLVFNA